jgi:hypothetical protein
MTARALERPAHSLAEIDASIDQTARGALTLCPTRRRATPLTDLVEALADGAQRPYLAAAAYAVGEAQLAAFPGNLLWDFDYYLASVHREALSSGDYAGHVEQATDITVGLMHLYGQDSTIRFQYVHDFIYGFDWARWVRREPETRSQTLPFSLEFLQQSDSRGRAILRLIEDDDEVYPKLEGSGPRNPFPFSRTPDEELRLYRGLSETGCIPVEAWSRDATPDATRDFDALRESAAQRLGLER